jgi:hypothetical protein
MKNRNVQMNREARKKAYENFYSSFNIEKSEIDEHVTSMNNDVRHFGKVKRFNCSQFDLSDDDKVTHFLCQLKLLFSTLPKFCTTFETLHLDDCALTLKSLERIVCDPMLEHVIEFYIAQNEIWFAVCFSLTRILNMRVNKYIHLFDDTGSFLCREINNGLEVEISARSARNDTTWISEKLIEHLSNDPRMNRVKILNADVRLRSPISFGKLRHLIVGKVSAKSVPYLFQSLQMTAKSRACPRLRATNVIISKKGLDTLIKFFQTCHNVRHLSLQVTLKKKVRNMKGFHEEVATAVLQNTSLISFDFYDQHPILLSWGKKINRQLSKNALRYKRIIYACSLFIARYGKIGFSKDIGLLIA